MAERLQTISWQEFQIRKNKARKKILEHIASRIESGRHSSADIDLDIVPILNAWDNVPFSYTVFSCSGTPSEHAYMRGEYCHVNGLKKNPNACLMAHSYMAHPLFSDFQEAIEKSTSGVADLQKSCVHSCEGFEGIYHHVVDIWVPEETKRNRDLFYLDRFWKKFKKDLDGFAMRNKGIDRLWGWPDNQ